MCRSRYQPAALRLPAGWVRLGDTLTQADLVALLVSLRAFIGPEAGVADNRSPFGSDRNLVGLPAANSSISARKCFGVSAAMKACWSSSFSRLYSSTERKPFMASNP